MRNNHEPDSGGLPPSTTTIDLTPVFRDAGMPHTATSSAAFEARYQLRARARGAPHYYELVWGVKLALDGSIPTRRLRTRRGTSLLLEMPVLWAERPNEDLRIVIHLPAPDRLHLVLEEEFRESPAERLLVAENDELLAAALHRTLGRAGFEVALARTGAAVLGLAQAENFDLALLDLDLPDIDALALCARLRGHPLTRNLPLVVCSAGPGSGDFARRAGAIGCVEKPLGFFGLAARLRGFLGRPPPADASGSAGTNGLPGS